MEAADGTSFKREGVSDRIRRQQSKSRVEAQEMNKSLNVYKESIRIDTAQRIQY